MIDIKVGNLTHIKDMSKDRKFRHSKTREYLIGGQEQEGTFLEEELKDNFKHRIGKAPLHTPKEPHHG